jgi:DNA repair protein RecO (recombination protein O)
LIRRVTYGESNAVLTFFTEELGKLGAVARGAQRSAKRFPALEPMHLLGLELDLVPGRELASLAEATLTRPRLVLTSSLARMQAAGQALRWLRRAAAPRTPEPRLWLEINVLLDALDCADSPAAQADTAISIQALLAATGLRMLEAAGWGLELSRCVRCERPCPERSRASIDPAAGGVVCRSCGAGGIVVSATQRLGMIRALGGDETGLGRLEDAEVALGLVERSLAAHAAEEAR